MWHQRCEHCERRQLFGIGRVVGLDTIAPGVLRLTWSCPNCGTGNELLTGRRVTASLAAAAATGP